MSPENVRLLVFSERSDSSRLMLMVHFLIVGSQSG